ncbi:MAG: HDOD domain-containing protein [Aeromicrobium sp.]|nr:HDOD domain-containing protein [Burkholderiales bacterium]
MEVAQRRQHPEPISANSMGTDPELVAIQLDSEKIARDLRLPPCPSIVEEFSRLMSDENADLRKMGDMVGKDLALAASILRAVNSPHYGLRRETTNLQHAVSIIGLKNTSCLIARLMIRQTFSSKSGRLMQEFWNDSANLSEIAGRIAPEVRCLDPDEVRTFVLFRNAGQAVMINRFEGYAPYVTTHQGGLALDLIDAEKAEFENSHNQIGYVLAKEWRLPEMMALAIYYHHDAKYFSSAHAPASIPIKRLIAFGFLVDQLAALGRGDSVIDGWEDIEPNLLKVLAITPDDIVRLAQSINAVA